jgi:hypothetical protein
MTLNINKVLKYALLFGVAATSCQEKGTTDSTRAAKYQLCEDGISFAVTGGKHPVVRMDHGSHVQIVNADEVFNRGIKRGHTILVTGDKPRFALMTTYPEAKLDPDLVKLGDARIRLVGENGACWLDECTQIKTVFHPSQTIYSLSHLSFPGLEISLLVSQANDWGAVAKLQIANVSKKTTDVRVDFTFGGISRKPRTFSAAYFQPDSLDGMDNHIDLQDEMAAISDGKWPDVVMVRTFPKRPLTAAQGRIFCTHPLQVAPETRSTLYFVAGRSAKVDTLKQLMAIVDPEQVIQEAQANYTSILKPYHISSPDQYLDAGFRTAVLNLDNVYAEKAWLEGVHWWSAYWTNNYQISAAISLGQLDRARTALLFYNHETIGPAPCMLASGVPNPGEKSGAAGLPYYIYELCQYFEQSGDTALVKRVWPPLLKSVRQLWQIRDADGNGLLNWRLGSNETLYQADHLGFPGDAASPSLLMAGMLEKLAYLAARIGQTKDMEWIKAVEEKIYRNLDSLWNTKAGAFYSHIDLQKIRHMSHYYTDLVFPTLYTTLADQYGWQSLDYLKRTLWLEAHLQNPARSLALMRVGDLKPTIFGSDNVMPVQMAEAARAFFKMGDYESGYGLLAAVALAGTIYTEAPGNFPERMNDLGKGEANYLFGNPIGSFIHSVVSGLYGLNVSDGGQSLVWTPGFPSAWDHTEFTIPTARIRYVQKQSAAHTMRQYTVEQDKARALFFATHVPVGQVKQVLVDGKPFPYRLEPAWHSSKLSLSLAPKRAYDIHVSYTPLPVDVAGPAVVEEERSAQWSCTRSIEKISDPQGALQNASFNDRTLQGTAAKGQGIQQLFVHLKDPAVIVPFSFSIRPHFAVYADTARYSVKDKSIRLTAQAWLPGGKSPNRLMADLCGQSALVKLRDDPDSPEPVHCEFVWADSDMPAEGTYKIRFHVANAEATYESTCPVVLRGRDQATDRRMCQVRDSRTRSLDIKALYNSETMFMTSAWRRWDAEIIRSSFLDHTGMLSTPLGSFSVPLTGPYLAVVQLGVSDPFTRLTLPVKYPRRIVLPVQQKVTMLSLLYATEVESRLTGSRVGRLTLHYSNGKNEEIPLLVNLNMQTMYTHFAADTYAVPVTVTRDARTDFINIYRISCDGGQVLESCAIEMDAADAQFGLLSANVTI